MPTAAELLNVPEPDQPIGRTNLPLELAADLSALGRSNEQAFARGAISEEEYRARQLRILNPTANTGPGEDDFGVLDAVGYVFNIAPAAVTNLGRLGLNVATGGEHGASPLEALKGTFQPGEQVLPSTILAESNLPGWAKFVGGLAGDILLDPLTYVGVGLVDDVFKGTRATAAALDAADIGVDAARAVKGADVAAATARNITPRLHGQEITQHLTKIVSSGAVPEGISKERILDAAITRNWRQFSNKELKQLGFQMNFKFGKRVVPLPIPVKATGNVVSTALNPVRNSSAKYLLQKAAGSGEGGVWSALFNESKKTYAQGLMAALDADSSEKALTLIQGSILTKQVSSAARKMTHSFKQRLEVIARDSGIDGVNDNIKKVFAGAKGADGAENAAFEALLGEILPVLSRTQWLGTESAEGLIRSMDAVPAMAEYMASARNFKLPADVAKTIGLDEVDLRPWVKMVAQNSDFMHSVVGTNYGDFFSNGKAWTANGLTNLKPSDAFNSERLASVLAQNVVVSRHLTMADGLLAPLLPTLESGKLLADVEKLGGNGLVYVGTEGGSVDDILVKAYVDTSSEKVFSLGELSNLVQRQAKGGLQEIEQSRFDEAVKAGLIVPTKGKRKARITSGLAKISEEVERDALEMVAGTYIGVAVERVSLMDQMLYAVRGATSEDELHDIATAFNVEIATVKQFARDAWEGSAELSNSVNLVKSLITKAQDAYLQDVRTAGGSALLITRDQNTDILKAIDDGLMSPAEANEIARELSLKNLDDLTDAEARALISTSEAVVGRSRGIPADDARQLRQLQEDALAPSGVKVSTTRPHKFNENQTEYIWKDHFLRGKKSGGVGKGTPQKHYDVLRTVMNRSMDNLPDADGVERWVLAGDLMKAEAQRVDIIEREMTDFVRQMRGSGTRRLSKVKAAQFEAIVRNDLAEPGAMFERLVDQGWSKQELNSALRKLRVRTQRLTAAAERYQEIIGSINIRGREEFGSILEGEAASVRAGVGARINEIAQDEYEKVRAVFAREEMKDAFNDYASSVTTRDHVADAQHLIDDLHGYISGLTEAELGSEATAKAIAAQVRRMQDVTKGMGKTIRSVTGDSDFAIAFQKTVNAPFNTDGAISVRNGYAIVDDSNAARTVLELERPVPKAKLNGFEDNVLRTLNDIFRTTAIFTPGFSVRNMTSGAIMNASFMENMIDSYRATTAYGSVAIAARNAESLTTDGWKRFAEREGIKESQSEFVRGLWNSIEDSDARFVLQRVTRETDFIDIGRVGETANEILEGRGLQRIRQRFASGSRAMDSGVALVVTGVGRKILGKNGKLSKAGLLEINRLSRSLTNAETFATAFRHGSPTVEFINRSALAIDVFSSSLRKGYSQEDAWLRALDMVDMVHFDYSDLSATQRRLRAAYVPFIAWRVNNIPLQWQRLMSGRWGPRFAIRSQFNNENRSEAFQSPYDRGNFALGNAFGGALTLGTRADPFTDILELGDALPGGNSSVRAVLANELSPVTKLLYEGLSGQDAATGYALRGGNDGMTAPAWQNVPVLGQTMGALFKAIGEGEEKDGVLLISSRADRAMRAMLPLLNWTKLVTTDSNPEIRRANGEPWDDQSIIINWLNFFGFDIRYLNDKTRDRNIKGETFELDDKIKKAMIEAGLIQ